MLGLVETIKRPGKREATVGKRDDYDMNRLSHASRLRSDSAIGFSDSRMQKAQSFTDWAVRSLWCVIIAL